MQAATKKRNNPNGRDPGSKKILASGALSIGNTKLIAEDIYNEPTSKQLESGQEWVRFFEGDSDFLKKLMGLVNYSPTLRRIVSDTTQMAVGDGFIPYDGKPRTMLTAMQSSRTVSENNLEDLEDALEMVNLHQETMVDVMQKAIYDRVAFGNSVVELVRGRNVDGPFCYIYHVPLWQVGIRKAGNDKIPKEIGIYDKWEDISLTRGQSLPDDFRVIPLYPAWSEADEEGVERSVIHVKNYAPGFLYWGLPEWIGAQLWVEMEYRIAKFNINEFEHGFSFSGIMQLFGSVSPDEAQEIITDIQNKFTDTGNHRKLFVQVLRDERLKANVQSISDIKDGHFEALQRLAAQAIVSACRWTMSLAGFATAGKLGTNEQIKRELEYVQRSVVKPLQNVILSRIINPFMIQYGEWTAAPWAGVQLGISNNIPIGFMGELDPIKVLLINEQREELGYNELDEEGMAQLINEQNGTIVQPVQDITQ